MKRKIFLILMSALIIAASLSVSSLASDDLGPKTAFDLINGTYTSGACKLEKSVDTIDGVNNFIVITDISNYTSQMFPLSHSLSVSSNGNTCVFEYNNSDRALMSANNAEYSEEKTTLTFVVENGKIDSITVAGSECFFTKLSAEFPEGEYAYCNFDGEYKIPDGTSEHPWDITSYNINYETQYVFAYVESDSLNICGYGDMKDYDDPSSRPWNDGIESITSIFVGDDIFYIGSNAFKNAGSAMIDDDWFDWFFCAVPEDVKAIGESAFENVPMIDIYLPENVYKIKSRAFANTKLTSITFYSKPAEIADDAFEGVTADAFTVFGMWEDGDKSNFGGKLTYSTLYMFEYEEVYGTDEMSGSGYMYVPETYILEYEFFDSDEYVFDRFEIIEGSLDVADFKNPVISSKIDGNVRLKVYYTPVSDQGGNRDDDPITDPTSPTMFSVSTVIIVIAIWFAVSAVASALIVIFVICRKDGKDKTENKN